MVNMKNAEIVWNALNRHGFESFLVGGCVRDILMKIEPHDIDMATDAVPEEMKTAFKDAGFKFVSLGEKFGTITIIFEENGVKENVEVTTFRSEHGFTDGRHPDTVVFEKSLFADLSRRDFTINAIAMHPVTKEIVDPFNGRKDIENRIIRFVGKPEERINEDKLRMFRPCRFVAKTGFVIDEESFSAIRDNVSKIVEVSSERIFMEWLKMMETDNADLGVWALFSSGLLNVIEPELARLALVSQPEKWHKFDVLTHCINSMMAIPKTKPLKRFATLRHDIGKTHCRETSPHFPHHASKGVEIFQTVADRLKMSNADRKFCSFIIGEHMRQFFGQLETKKGVRKWLANIGDNDPLELFEVWTADVIGTGKEERMDEEMARLERVKACVLEVLNEKPVVKIKDLAISGHDLIAIGIPQDENMARTFKVLMEKVIENPELNNRETLIDIALNLK